MARALPAVVRAAQAPDPGGPEVAYALSPLAYLFAVIADPARSPSERMAAAKAAAPYVHRRAGSGEPARRGIRHEDALDELE